MTTLISAWNGNNMCVTKLQKFSINYVQSTPAESDFVALNLHVWLWTSNVRKDFTSSVREVSAKTLA